MKHVLFRCLSCLPLVRMSCLEDFTCLNINLETHGVLILYFKIQPLASLWVGRVGSGQYFACGRRVGSGRVTKNGLVDFWEPQSVLANVCDCLIGWSVRWSVVWFHELSAAVVLGLRILRHRHHVYGRLRRHIVQNDLRKNLYHHIHLRRARQYSLLAYFLRVTLRYQLLSFSIHVCSFREKTISYL